MPFSFSQTLPILKNSKKPLLLIEVMAFEEFKKSLKKRTKKQAEQIAVSVLEVNKEGFLPLYGKDGGIDVLLYVYNGALDPYTGAVVYQAIQKSLSEKLLSSYVFSINPKSLSEVQCREFALSWALASYEFSHLKEQQRDIKQPKFITPECVCLKSLTAHVEAIFKVRNLVNLPANHLGPAEIEQVCRDLAKTHEAKISVIADTKLLDKNFPLVYTVGEAAAGHRRPRLIELEWGDKKKPLISLVGKGVCFDTGGLDLKPSQYMKLMKKDMGGAAHVLGLAHLIMSHKLPVRLKVIIPAVENSVSGAAFRPGDVIKSRKGIFVENTNTDAEGRLILADALCYASESKPELIIDFATLTGSARAALGQEIPAMFSSNDEIGSALQKLSFEINDPVWQMPLYQSYRRHLKADTGDIVNSAGLPGDLIYSALFLQGFVAEGIDWVHFDTFAWESSSRPGRSKGGADMGMRAMFEYLKKRFG